MKPLLSRLVLHLMAAAAPPQQQTTRPRVTYWAGRGRMEPIRCILAAADVTFDSIFLHSKEDFEQLAAQNKVAYGQVPLVEVDGLCLVQTMPTAVYLAETNGLWPESPRDRMVAGQIVAATQDARGPFLAYPFHLDQKKVLEEIQGEKGLLVRYCATWEAMLEPDRGPYFLQNPSLADICVFEVLDFFRHIFGDDTMRSSLLKFPRVLALHDAVLQMGRLKIWRDEERPKLFIADWADYAKVVRATLE